MIIKWQDDQGISLFDYVIHASHMAGENAVQITRATLDDKLVANNFRHGHLEVLSDKGAIIAQYDLGPRPVAVEDHPHPHPHPH